MPPRPVRSATRSTATAQTPRAARTPTTPQKDDKRKQILKAAVKVFAEKGYHGCRISDVAEEAGVAYGLVYHYYGNKDGLLASVFDTNWSVFAKAINDIADTPGMTMFEKLRQIVEAAFQAFEMFPLVVKVLVLEFGRNSRLGEALENPAVGAVFASIASIFEEGKKSGELYESIDPYAMSGGSSVAFGAGGSLRRTSSMGSLPEVLISRTRRSNTKPNRNSAMHDHCAKVSCP
jgi:AcrR family transcriptional regulator